VFTALTGAIFPVPGWPAFALLAMLAVRFLFGLGEAGAYPNIARAFHNWFPFQERGSAKGTVWMAGRFAGGVTPFIVLAMIHEGVVAGPGGVDLTDPRHLTALVKYDSEHAEYRGVIEATPDGLKINGHRVRVGDAEILVGDEVVVPADAHLLHAGSEVPSGKLELRVAGKDLMVGQVEARLNGRAVDPASFELFVTEQWTVYWRYTFWIFGGLGLVWCVLFWWWFRDRPEQKPGVNAAEISLIHAGQEAHSEEKLRVPWRRLLGSGNLWLLCMMYFCASYGWYFNITYLPGFLRQQFHVASGDKWTWDWWSFSLMAGLPLLLGSVACLVGGLMTDAFIRRTGNRRWGRRLFGMTGHGLCAAFYFVALGLLVAVPQREARGLGLAWLFVLSIAVATFWNDMTMGSAWASCLDIGGRYSGIVAGCMNTVGNLGGFAANILTGLILKGYTGGLKEGTAAYFDQIHPAWVLNFLLFGGVYVIAVVLWAFFDSTKPVAAGAPAPAAPEAEAGPVAPIPVAP
jgi:nitrate/nitrite transporter NarK